MQQLSKRAIVYAKYSGNTLTRLVTGPYTCHYPSIKSLLFVGTINCDLISILLTHFVSWNIRTQFEYILNYLMLQNIMSMVYKPVVTFTY